MAENQSPTKKEIADKPKKKKGPIRSEAVIPFVIVVALTWAYFHFFFDLHLRKTFEFAGYQLLGAQVDVANVETSFFKGTFRVQGIEVTNAEKPSHNMVKIGDIRFGVLWDALLKAKVVVDEMAVEQIEIDVPRKSPGKVKPPEPTKPGEEGSGAVDKLKDQALDKVEDKYDKNVLGDLAAILGGTDSQAQLGKIEGSLASKARLKEIETEYQEKSKKWQEKMATLPKGPEIQSLGDRLGKVKTSNFKSPQELQQSLSEIDAIVKEADAKYKSVQSAGTDLSADLKALDQGIKELDAMVKKDIKDLETRFKIPSLDAKSLSKSIFYPYIQPYIAQFNRYKGLAQKYVPPNLMDKTKRQENKADMIQPHVRDKGVTYEFPHTNSYPLFWVKKISVSSKSGPSQYTGDLKGLITDVTSNQPLVGRPTVAKLEGDFPGMQVTGFLGKLTVDNLKETSKISYEFGVGSYAIAAKELVQSPDVQLAFKKANGSLRSTGELVGLKDFKFELNNKFQNVDYQIASKTPAAEEILNAIFASLPAITLEANGSGVLPGLSLNINSNLGPELAKGFERQLQAKIAEARAKLQAYVDQEVGKNKAKLEADFNKAKSQVEGEIKKIQDQLNAEKAKGEAKVNQAKKDAENQAKKGLESEVKKALGNDGDKKLEDLKKKLGL
jgi:uncharacterized protein (TIGR03545 family)